MVHIRLEALGSDAYRLLACLIGITLSRAAPTTAIFPLNALRLSMLSYLSVRSSRTGRKGNLDRATDVSVSQGVMRMIPSTLTGVSLATAAATPHPRDSPSRKK